MSSGGGRGWRGWGPLLGVSVALGGCKVGPEYARPAAPVAQSWSVKDSPQFTTQAAADNLWWKSFSDPTLDRLVDAAYQQNLPLQVAGLRIVEARARWGVASGQQFPQFQEVYGSAALVGLSENAASLANAFHYLDYRTGFDAAWEADFWGKYGRGVEAEANTLLAAEADYYSGIVSLTAEVARSYVLIRTTEVLVAQAQENARIQEDSLRIAQSRFRNGATSELDVAQATALLESTRASIPQLMIGMQQAQNALSTLLGQPTGSVMKLMAGPGDIPRPPAQVAISVPADLLRRRPDIRRAELAAAAQCARVGVAQAELYPSFALLGTIGLEANADKGHFPNLFSLDSLFYSFGPRISWPFFNYGRLRNATRIEDARFQQLLIDYQDTVIRAAQEVEDALAGYLNAQQALAFEEAAVKASQRSVELAVVQYREGATDYQRVLDAQRSLLQQQTSLTQARSSVVTYLIGLFKALGGGWELRQGQPYVPEQTQTEMKARTNWGDLLSQPRPPETKTPPMPAAH